MLVAAATQCRAKSCLIAAESLQRAALACDGEMGDMEYAETWLGLAAVQLDRGNLMASRLSFARARGINREVANQRPGGVGELFAAVDLLEACGNGGAHGSDRGSELKDSTAALRRLHMALYYRYTLAMEAGSWEVLAALGEFYRLVGCPAPPLCQPHPDNVTALSYFEQAHCMAPSSPFVLDRLARLAAQAESEAETAA